MIDLDKTISAARKNHNVVALNVYQAIKAEKLLLMTAKNAKPYDEGAEVSLLRKMIKTREDSANIYKQANRTSLADAELTEIEVLKQLLPKPIDMNDIRMELIGWCQAHGYCHSDGADGEYVPKKEMGSAIKHLKQFYPTADGRIISDLVKEYVQS